MRNLRSFLIIIVFLFFLFVINKQTVLSYTAGSPAGYTNSPFDNKTCTNCHAHTGQPFFKPALISSDIPVCGFVEGDVYSITLSVTSPNTNRFGFICSPQNQAGILLGNLLITDSVKTKIAGTKYVTHTSSGVLGVNNQHQWSFNWEAPFGVNEVTFYAAFTAGSAFNDSTFYSSFTVYAHVSDIEEHQDETDFVFLYPNPIKDKIWIEKKDVFSSLNYVLYNGVGQLLFVGQLEDFEEVIDFSSLPNGVYYIRFYNDNLSQSHKIIKNK